MYYLPLPSRFLHSLLFLSLFFLFFPTADFISLQGYFYRRRNFLFLFLFLHGLLYPFTRGNLLGLYGRVMNDGDEDEDEGKKGKRE